MRFFYKLGLVPTPETFKRMMYNAYIMAPDGQKMSKSKGNVIDPMEIMDSNYGADGLKASCKDALAACGLVFICAMAIIAW